MTSTVVGLLLLGKFTLGLTCRVLASHVLVSVSGVLYFACCSRVSRCRARYVNSCRPFVAGVPPSYRSFGTTRYSPLALSWLFLRAGSAVGVEVPVDCDEYNIL